MSTATLVTLITPLSFRMEKRLNDNGLSAFISTVFLSLFSLVVVVLARHHADRNGGIFALVGKKKGGVPGLSRSTMGFYKRYHKLFDGIWIAHTLVCVLAITILYLLKIRSFALVLGLYRTLSQRMHWARLWPLDARIRPFLIILVIPIVLLVLISSVFLLWHNLPIAGKALVLSVVCIFSLWSMVLSFKILRVLVPTVAMPPELKQWSLAWAWGILGASIISISVGSWWTLGVPEEDVEEFVEVRR
ncbi:hypothetical protein B0T24DRAFT_309966 [Lasiosphaeria ovina]|uniref:Uncharacterized protein n=1 Tax=Lasiosphaeria ovina TaxID=92902 RepID=A0AAE0K7Z8_9PEZI|nr:hypothetical protein B0T24DRAFT_309966 [Lasiosphaeria ovina]